MGRPKGSPNKATTEIKLASRKLLQDKGYQDSLKFRLAAGKAPHMEVLLHHYAFGKPADKTEHTGEDGGPILYKTVDEFHTLPKP